MGSLRNKNPTKNEKIKSVIAIAAIKMIPTTGLRINHVRKFSVGCGDGGELGSGVLVGVEIEVEERTVVLVIFFKTTSHVPVSLLYTYSEKQMKSVAEHFELAGHSWQTSRLSDDLKEFSGQGLQKAPVQ